MTTTTIRDQADAVAEGRHLLPRQDLLQVVPLRAPMVRLPPRLGALRDQLEEAGRVGDSLLPRQVPRRLCRSQATLLPPSEPGEACRHRIHTS